MTVPSSYLEDASGFQGQAERLFIPETEGEVASALADAQRTRTPVTLAGAGTGLTGGRVAEGGWVLSTERLLRLEIADGSAVAGAGVLLSDVHAAAARTGQLYPPDPTETSASLGGTIATNASGSRSFRYGATRRYVERLRVVLVGGEVLEIPRGQGVDFTLQPVPAPATTKNTAGYALSSGMDLVDLFIGSEGTLGVITEATLRLLPAPESVIAAVVFFESDTEVVAAVDDWRTVEGVRVLEYFDRGSLELLSRSFEGIPPSAGAALMLEQELSGPEEEAVDAWLDRLEAAGADLESSWFANSPADRERFRVFRHALPEAVNDIVRRNGFQKVNSDYAVPLERNGEMLSYYHERLGAELAGKYTIVGHIGDAHVHVNILPTSPEEYRRGAELMFEFARHAVLLGGTVSAEHGLGKRKRDLLAIQYPPDALDAMRAVKSRFDPDWLLGRGTLFAPPPLT